MRHCDICKGTGRVVYAPGTCTKGGEGDCYGCGGTRACEPGSVAAPEGDMIRLRDKATGAEAEWDRRKWSGDEGLVERLQRLMRIERIPGFSHETFASIQARMAETFPGHGLVVVRQTKPEELEYEADEIP